MKPKSQSLFRCLSLSAVALTALNSYAADVTLTGSSVINGMNTNYTVNSPDALILNITGTGGNRASDSMGAAIAKSGGNLTIDGSGTLRVTGGISDVLGIADVSNRTVNISLGSGGLIDIQGGALVNGGWGGGVWTNNFADMNIASGAVFDVWDGGAIRVDALTGAGSVQNGSNNSGVRSLVVGVDSGSGTFSGVIGGGTGRLGNNAISLTKEGSGTQILSGSNTYLGTTTVTSGTLQIGDGGTTGSLGSGNVSISGNLAFNRSNTYGTVSGQVFSGTGTIIKNGTGDLIFNGSVNHTNVQGISNVVVNDGLIRTDNWGQWNSNLNLTVNDSGKFEMWNTTTSIGNLSGNGTVQNTKYWGRSQTLTIAAGSFSGTITDLGITSGGLGTGDTRINLIKSTSDTLTLSGTNGYTGTTTVSSGKLVINGSISTSSLTTVNSGATLGGSGTVGSLTVNSGAYLNPGTSPGTLTVDGDYSQGGQLTIEINGLTAGIQHDQVNVDRTSGDGSVGLSGSLVTAFGGGSYVNGDLIFILLNDGTDAISGTFSGLAQDAIVTSYGGFDWKISYTADSGNTSFTGGNDIALMAVPEPGAALLGGLGLLALLRRRR